MTNVLIAVFVSKVTVLALVVLGAVLALAGVRKVLTKTVTNVENTVKADVSKVQATASIVKKDL